MKVGIQRFCVKRLNHSIEYCSYIHGGDDNVASNKKMISIQPLKA